MNVDRSSVRRGSITIRGLAGIALSLLALSACSREPADYPTANISPYNHTEDYIHQLYVNEAYGGNSRAFGGGGSFVCCIVYPREWHEGLTAKVRWTTSSSVPGGSPEETWHEKIVPIERYERTGTTLNVHFLPDHEVRLIVSSKGAGHPEYPGPDAPDPPPGWPPKPPLPEATAPDHLQPPPAPPSNTTQDSLG